MKKMTILFLCFIQMISLTGCWDKTELEDYGYVAVIGIDKGKGGIGNKWDITFQITNPQVGTSPSANVPEPSRETITVPATGPIAARDIASAAITRRLTFTHAKAFIVSEEVAKGEEFYNLMAAVERDREIRDEINIIICKERAEEFIRKNKPPLETRPNKYYSFMAERWKETGLVPLATLTHFLARSQENVSTFLAIYATTMKVMTKKDPQNEADYIAGQIDIRTENPTEMIGSVVLKKGKIIGKLTGEETKLSLLLRPKRTLRGIGLTVPDPEAKEEKISTRVFADKKPQITMKLDGTVPMINVIVPVKIEVVAITSLYNYVTDVKEQKILKQEIEQYLEEQSLKLIKKTQQEFQAEPFDWGKVSKKYFLTLDEYQKFDWMKSYPSAQVSLKYVVQLKNFGKQTMPPKIYETKE